MRILAKITSTEMAEPGFKFSSKVDEAPEYVGFNNIRLMPPKVNLVQMGLLHHY